MALLYSLAALVLSGLAALAPRCATAQSTHTTKLAFSTPPYDIATEANLTAFRIEIPDQDIQELDTYLRLFKVPKQTYENSAAGWFFGVPADWLVGGVEYWLHTFDWYSLLAMIAFPINFELTRPG